MFESVRRRLLAWIFRMWRSGRWLRHAIAVAPIVDGEEFNAREARPRDAPVGRIRPMNSDMNYRPDPWWLQPEPTHPGAG